MLEALRILAARAMRRILMPSYICRDVLAPVNILGLEVVWYHVNEDLTPVLPPHLWPKADAVIAVNYFGFPQNLSPFQIYALENDATIIEDNAHGYLSRDDQGRWLGYRTNIGIFSLRKTFRLADGSALRIGEMYEAEVAEQVPINGRGINRAQPIKAKLRSVPLIGEILLKYATSATRNYRRILNKPISGMQGLSSEFEINGLPNAWFKLLATLHDFDFDAEIDRRRNAYYEFQKFSQDLDIYPVFSELPTYCAPYGFPFRGTKSGIDAMTEFAKKYNFDLVTWPELPAIHQSSSPDYYNNINLVNFLW